MGIDFTALTAQASNFVGTQLGGQPLPPNAVLTVRAISGALTEDTSTGNVHPSTEEVELSVFLKPDRKPQLENYPGIDENSEPMIGKLVEPLALPDGIGKLTRGRVTIGDRTGTCVLNYPVQSAFGSNDFLGDKVYVAVKWQV